MSKKGKLYLIPVPIAEPDPYSIPESVIRKMHQISHFIVERARTGRRYIKSTGYEGDISSLSFTELDKRNPEKFEDVIFRPAFGGEDIGLMSEAGMPGIADPGAQVVKRAHDLEIEVVPLVGPSSLFLALAASGLNGQQFCFHGYLPVKKPQLAQKINELEKRIRQSGETQLFIETPYRNETLIQSLLSQCHPATRLCIASELTGQDEYIKTRTIGEWKTAVLPDLHKKTTVFLLGK
jgi:16S rRNA (cytidine1402-2'-O)-methyltransferase